MHYIRPIQVFTLWEDKNRQLGFVSNMISQPAAQKGTTFFKPVSSYEFIINISECTFKHHMQVITDPVF